MTVGLAGCGGGGGIIQPASTPAPTIATSSGSVSATGGTVSTTLGTETLLVQAPAGAFSSAATLKVTLEAPSSLSAAFAVARAASSRSTQSIPSGAVPLAGFIVDGGGAALAAPLQVSFTGIAGPASGQSIMIAGYQASNWNDVAATTYASGTTTETTNPKYPGITLASQTLYVIYTVPTTSVATPTATVTVAGPATASVGTQATYTASETTPNGFPFLGHTFTFSAGAAIGSITAAGVLTPVATGGIGNVTATDAAVSSFTGIEAVTISSSRPGTTGLSEQYAGTLTEVDANNAIAGGPNATPSPTQTPVSITTTAKATVAVTTTADTADTTGSTTAVTFTANETDAASLSTLTSTTTSNVLYQTQSNGTVNVRLAKTIATESTGVIYENDYTATNGLTTILPETAGTFTNDASEKYLETDPGIGVTSNGQQVTTTTTYNADGTYSSTFLDPSVSTGVPTADTATENSDFSGVLNFNSIDPSAYVISFAAPSSGSITVTLTDPNFSLNNAIPVNNWIPATSTQPSMETDTIAPGATVPCANASTYPTAASVTQQKTIVDTVFGTVENRTMTSYDVAGVGTVCTVLSDTVNTYYDYSEQEGYFLYVSSTPLLTTTVSETLALQSTNASQLQSGKRSAQAVSVAMLPLATIAAHVEHLARQRTMQRIRELRQHASLATIRGGSIK